MVPFYFFGEFDGFIPIVCLSSLIFCITKSNSLAKPHVHVSSKQILFPLLVTNSLNMLQHMSFEKSSRFSFLRNPPQAVTTRGQHHHLDLRGCSQNSQHQAQTLLRKGVGIGHESFWVNVFEDPNGDETVITLV
jgi:hypothetical protein